MAEEEYMEHIDQEEHEQYQNEEENIEHENEDAHQEYEYHDNHNNVVQEEEIQENKPPQTTKIQKNPKISKTSQKTTSKKSSKKTNKKEAQSTKTNLPNKNQMNKYKETSIKAMNYRVDIYKTQENCKKLEKVNKERDTLKNYLDRLEKVMQKKTDTDNNDTTKIKTSLNKIKNTTSTINKSLTNQNENESNLTEQSDEKTNDNMNENKLTISMSGTAPVITMDDGQGNKNIIKSKASLMKFLYKIYMENQNLKNFQGQVFNLSKNYDDINNILAESISGFQDIVKSTKKEDIINEVNNRLKELKEQVESSMEQKQSEYNAQLEKKEEEINILNKAYNNVYKEIQQKKSDKLHEQKTIEDLNSQIEILETKLAYLKQKH
jgi:hypothetical protein